MKFTFFNDTGRVVHIHAGTSAQGVVVQDALYTTSIDPLQTRTFVLPDGTQPWVKMWDRGEHGLCLFVGVEREGVSQ